jgi:DNA (cytosine-5)-methyltransferase 1
MMRRNSNGTVQGNLVSRNNSKIVSRYRYIGPGQNWESIPKPLLDNYKDFSRCHTGIYHRLEWNRPAKVIGNYRKNMLIHPEENRGLSVREAARLQSFPDNYVFVGSIGFQQQQVADAVPPLLAEAVANAIKHTLAHTRLSFAEENVKGSAAGCVSAKSTTLPKKSTKHLTCSEMSLSE